MSKRGVGWEEPAAPSILKRNNTCIEGCNHSFYKREKQESHACESCVTKPPALCAQAESVVALCKELVQSPIHGGPNTVHHFRGASPARCIEQLRERQGTNLKSACKQKVEKGQRSKQLKRLNEAVEVALCKRIKSR